jgi:hypothetical protein
VLPFRGPSASGALEIMLAEEGGVPEDDVALARASSRCSPASR